MFNLDKHQPVTGTVSIEIEKSVETVFDFVARDFFSNYPKWALEVIEFKAINGNPMAEGALAKQTRLEQGHKVESTFEIVQYIPNKQLTLNGLSDPFRQDYLFASVDRFSTQLTARFSLLELEVFMRPFEKLIRRATEEGLKNSLENINQLLCADNYRNQSCQ